MLSVDLGRGARLGALEPWHAAEFAAHIDRHRAYLDVWVPLGDHVTDESSARRYLEAYAERAARDEGRLYGVWLDGELVGGTLFRTFELWRRTCELGVWLAPEATGRGLVTAACREMLDWAFGERAMLRAEWLAQPGNARSVAVARRLGMRREGVLRWAGRHRGAQVDLEMWAVLATEWPTAR